MQKKLLVTSTERSSGKRTTLFEGIGNIDNLNEDVNISYLEKDQRTHVELKATPSEGFLRRNGEADTRLHFDSSQPHTVGFVESELGCIELKIHTHTYIRTLNVIAIEYDVMNGSDVVEAYRLVWKIKELSA